MKYCVYASKKNEFFLLAPTKLLTIVSYVRTDTLDVVRIVDETLPLDAFKKAFSPAKDYPPEKLAELFLQYARTSGATPKAIEVLGELIDIKDKDGIIMTDKKPTAKKAPVKKAAAKKPAAKASTAKASAKTAAKKVEAEKAAKRPSAAARFKELILAGKHTDDQIFAMVQKEFDLPDSKRTYVAWYRNDMTKKGLTPPAAK